MLLYMVAGFVGTAACDAARAAQYIVPMVRDVEARTGAPVLIGGFVDCKAHVP
jgi:hypothetical protein